MSSREKRVFKRHNSEAIRAELEVSMSDSSIEDNCDEDPDYSPLKMEHSYAKGRLPEILNSEKFKINRLFSDDESDDNSSATKNQVTTKSRPKYFKVRPSTSADVVLSEPFEVNPSTSANLVQTQSLSKCDGTVPKAIVEVSKPLETRTNNVQVDIGLARETAFEVGDGLPIPILHVQPKQKITRAKRGLSCPKNWKRNKTKVARLSGEAYSVNGVEVPAKQCGLNNCGCALKCNEKIPENVRLQIFNHFYKTLKTKNEQSAFLVGSVVQYNKKRSYVSGCSRREKTRSYFLKHDGNDVRVCKRFFQSTLQVSSGGLDRALKGFNELGVPKPDSRGKHCPINKRKDEDVQVVIDFIKSIPKYRSHYTREKNPNKEFFSPGLNYSKLYNLYCSKCKETGLKEVSLSVFKNELKTKFNIGFHKPLKDTCKTCDILHNKIKVASAEEKQGLEIKLHLHHKSVEKCNETYESDKQLCRLSGETTVFTFDLMKTLPTPHLSTGIVYYKRQLWTFCFGIHDTAENNAYMKIWDETMASRGSCEVASSLLHYFAMKNLNKEIIAWSDACGGQNRNIYMSLFWLFIVTSENFNVDRIKHKFFVSGHSYNDSDKDFGLVEKNKPDNGIFVPSHWADVVRTAKKKKPFIVNEMARSDFYDIKQLKEYVTHRKSDKDGGKVSWLNIAVIEVRRESPYSIFCKYSHHDEEPYHEIDVTKYRPARQFGPPVGPVGTQTLQKLNQSEVTLTAAKVADLQSLLPLIPPIYHDFYLKLQGDNTNEFDTLPGVEEEDEEEND